MRLFVAVDVNPAVAQAFGGVIEELRTRTAVLAPRARITWGSAERAHITVRFIGEVNDAKAGTIAAALQPALAASACDVNVSGVGAFPRSGSPRVLWAGLTEGVQGLVDLEREVSARLDACGIPREDRPYRPHLTLARVRDAAGLRTQLLLKGFADREFGTTRVDAITLYESRLSPQGSAYVPLQWTPLRRV